MRSKQPHTLVTQLPSGLRVVTERMPAALSVAAGVWVGVGARDEPSELSGVSHFLEHLLFKGTEDRSARDIADAVDRVGGDMNAFTAKEYTAYYCRLPAERLPLGIELLGDVLTSPALRDADVESERQVILEELAMDDDPPEDVAHRLLAEALFPEHPLGPGDRGDGRNGRGHHARRRPDLLPPLVPAVVDGGGRSRRRRPRRWSWPRSSGASRPLRLSTGPSGIHPRIEPRGVVVDRRRSEQAHVALGFRGLARDDPDREALDVVNHVLGGGMSSRLFDEIREQRGLAYAVGSGTSSYTDAGSLTIYAGTAPSQVPEVLG